MYQADWVRVAFEGPLALSRFDIDMRGVPIPGQGFFFPILEIARAHGSVIVRVRIDVEEKNILVQLDTQKAFDICRRRSRQEGNEEIEKSRKVCPDREDPSPKDLI